jgi:hypothetical protein
MEKDLRPQIPGLQPPGTPNKDAKIRVARGGILEVKLQDIQPGTPMRPVRIEVISVYGTVLTPLSILSETSEFVYRQYTDFGDSLYLHIPYDKFIELYGVGDFQLSVTVDQLPTEEVLFVSVG